MEEEWRPVVGYEGLYEVSNLGRIRTVEHYCFRGRYNQKSLVEPRIRVLNEKSGYLKVNLSKGSKRETLLVHRLVAEAFIPNPEGLPQVNHKDENKKNNAVWNLEWCTVYYNNNYGTHNERCRSGNIGKKHSEEAVAKVAAKHKKPVVALKDGVIVLRFESAADANRFNKDFNYIGISACCNERLNTYKGYKWQFEK